MDVMVQLHIHVLDGAIREDFLKFFGNSRWSKHYNPWPGPQGFITKKISATPQVAVGHASVFWFQQIVAGKTPDPSLIAEPVAAVCQVIGEDLPIIDDALIEKITAALRLKNQTKYPMFGEDKVIDFLQRHKGRECFTVFW
jgi:hypothetical protein